MDSPENNDSCAAAQPPNTKIPGFQKPTRAGGWLVGSRIPVKLREAAHAAEPHKYRDWSPTRYEWRRGGLRWETKPVSLPALRFMR